jgi:uncharacterized protein (TIGR02246 family)
MKRTTILAGLLVAVTVLGIGLAQEKSGGKSTPNEQKAIREVAAAFTKAFNNHDAKGIGALFLPDAKVVTEDGDVVEGREAIAALFADQFNDSPKSTVEVMVDSITFVGSDMAIEVGSTKTLPGPGEELDISKYTVIHLKRDGKWLMAFARDSEGDTPTNNERLQPLAWLVGDWIDESPDAVVMTSCRWSPDKNFLLQDIQVQTAGKPFMTINQRIGWDQLQKCVHSWVFDSEGGFGEGIWTRTDDGWVIKATGVRSDGSTGSATNIVTPAGKNEYVWRSTDRVVGGNLEDDVMVRVVRKPPTSGKK